MKHQCHDHVMIVHPNSRFVDAHQSTISTRGEAEQTKGRESTATCSNLQNWFKPPTAHWPSLAHVAIHFIKPRPFSSKPQRMSSGRSHHQTFVLQPLPQTGDHILSEVFAKVVHGAEILPKALPGCREMDAMWFQASLQLELLVHI